MGPFNQRVQALKVNANGYLPIWLLDGHYGGEITSMAPIRSSSAFILAWSGRGYVGPSGSGMG